LIGYKIDWEASTLIYQIERESLHHDFCCRAARAKTFQNKTMHWKQKLM